MYVSQQIYEHVGLTQTNDARQSLGDVFIISHTQIKAALRINPWTNITLTSLTRLQHSAATWWNPCVPLDGRLLSNGGVNNTLGHVTQNGRHSGRSDNLS